MSAPIGGWMPPAPSGPAPCPGCAAPQHTASCARGRFRSAFWGAFWAMQVNGLIVYLIIQGAGS